MGEHHHTHHHHKEDGASRFKHKSLAAIRKRKQMEKEGIRFLEDEFSPRHLIGKAIASQVEDFSLFKKLDGPK